MATTGKLPHRERKNGASNESWQKRKRAANEARPSQLVTTLFKDDKVERIVGPYRG